MINLTYIVSGFNIIVLYYQFLTRAVSLTKVAIIKFMQSILSSTDIWRTSEWYFGKTLNSDNGFESPLCIISTDLHQECSNTRRKIPHIIIIFFCSGFHHEHIQWAKTLARSGTWAKRRIKNGCLHSLINSTCFAQDRTNRVQHFTFVSIFFCCVFSHCFICTKNREAAYCLLLTACWQGFCMCILLGQISLARWCFTDFATEQLYPPGALKQTQISLTSFLFPFYIQYRIHTFENLTDIS